MNHIVAAGMWLPVFFVLVLLGAGAIAYFLGYFTPPR
jgi:hypothetical protein